MDLLDDPREGANEPEFTVSEISGAVKRTIEGAFDHVRIRGEVGRVVHARSGHLYFDIKDDRAVLGCTAWKGQVARLTIKPEEGMEIIATGRLTTFPGQSKYQMNVQDVVVAGEGALMAMLEKRKKALAAEGLFDADRKQRLPFLPEIVGVITSPTGAVIRDILHRLRDRFPRKVLVWPVAVQGEKCAPDVARAIAGFNALSPGGALPRPDLLIVARGGGSIEDLWGFNEEIVARAAAASQIPLISAVGHETDTTLIDFASDLRAPTPTAAAEHAVPVRAELLARLEETESRRISAVQNALAYRAEKLRDMARAMPRGEMLTAQPNQRLDLASAKLPVALMSRIDRGKASLATQAGALRPRLLSQSLTNRRTRIGDFWSRAHPALERSTEQGRRELTALQARFERLPAVPGASEARRQLADAMRRLSAASAAGHLTRTQKLAGLERLRQTLGYQATLERGYAVVRGAQGDIVTTATDAMQAPTLSLEFADGAVSVRGEGAHTARVPEAAKGPEPTVKPAKKAKPKGTPSGTDGQGSLF